MTERQIGAVEPEGAAALREFCIGRDAESADRAREIGRTETAPRHPQSVGVPDRERRALKPAGEGSWWATHLPTLHNPVPHRPNLSTAPNRVVTNGGYPSRVVT